MEKVLDQVDTTTLFGHPHSVVLFNDDVHSFDEVIRQIIKALQCGTDKASAIAMEAHASGQAIAFTGSLERCEHVESILAGPPAALRTNIQPA